MSQIHVFIIGLCFVHLFLEVSTVDYEKTYLAIPGNASELHPECSDSYVRCAPFELLLQKFLTSYTRLVLLTGVHEVKQKSVVEIRDAKQLCITGANHMKNISVTVDHNIVHVAQPESVIQCSNGARFGLVFHNITNLTISKITITGCGGWLESRSYQRAAPAYLGSTIIATLFLANVRDVYIDTVSVQNATIGHGLVVINILGNSTITNSSFLRNNRFSIEYFMLYPYARFLGGNAVFLFTDSDDCRQSKDAHNLSIADTVFLRGTKEVVPRDNWYPPALQGGPGLSIVIASCTLNLNIAVYDIIVGKNHALQSAGLNLWIGLFMSSRNFSLSIMRPTIFSPIALTPNLATVGVTYNLELPQDVFTPPTCDCRFSFSNSSKVVLSDINISNVGAMAILLEEAHVSRYNSYLVHSFSIDQCTVSGNYADFSRATGMLVVQQGPQTNVKMEIRNCIFQGITSALKSSATILAQSSAMVLKNCIFSDNLNTALHISGYSSLTFEGNITFCNNSGLYGGAILFEGYQTYLFLMPHTHVQLIENRALVTGGAIHVSSRQNSGILDSDVSTYCFLQIDCEGISLCSGVRFRDLAEVQTSLNLQIRFVNNTAVRAGSTIWGGSVEDCVLAPTNERGYQSRLVDLFQIEHNDSDQTSIASPPQHICYCSESNICTSKMDPFLILENETIFTYPGQLISITIGIIGQMKGFIPALIQAEVDPSTRIEQFQQTQRIVEAKCTTLFYTLYALTKPNSGVDYNTITFTTAADGLDYSLDYYAQAYMQLQDGIVIPVSFKECPTGFQYSPESKSCACLQPLLKYVLNISCDINTQTVQRTASIWIDAFYTTNHTQILAVHQHCPFDYCKPSKHSLDLDFPDQQCAHNRSGILCGGCKEGLSLTLGSPKCRKCSYNFLSLLIVFAVAGTAVVAVLTSLNLTVSVGTINGLILYANIIRAIHPVFFPTTNVLSVFIAWINLDIGLNSCFYDGMDFYALTWLQFLFPVYIWLIVAIIIITSHYSTTAAKLVSRDAVKVLATLFLLSYAKLLRTFITVLSFTYITYEGANGVFDRTAVWVYDGNVRFMQGKHIPLFIVALAFGLFYIIPFTLLLLMAPLLQSKSHQYRALRWVNRIMPFLDAFQGPYNKNFRFWSGLLLSVRVILFVAFAVNILGDTQINLMLITTCLVGILSLQWLLGGVYKFGPIYEEALMNYLEIFFLLNMTVLSIWSLIQMDSATSTIKTQITISNVCVGLAFVVFILIITYHAYMRVKACGGLKMLKKSIHAKQPTAKDTVDPHNSRNEGEQVMTAQNVEVTRTVIELREPLLTDN